MANKDEDMAQAFDIGEDWEFFVFADCDDTKSEATTSTTSNSDLEMECFLCLKSTERNLVFCAAPCAADVRGAQRDAASQGPQSKNNFHAT